MASKIGGRLIHGIDLYSGKYGNQNISAVYVLPFKVTKNIKLSMFQFKINHHILYTRRADEYYHKFCCVYGINRSFSVALFGMLFSSLTLMHFAVGDEKSNKFNEIEQFLTS